MFCVKRSMHRWIVKYFTISSLDKETRNCDKILLEVLVNTRLMELLLLIIHV